MTLDGLISGISLYKSRITNKKLNFGSSFNSSNTDSLAIAGKANKALKILITAFTLTGVFELDLIALSDSAFLISGLEEASTVLISIPHNFEISLAYTSLITELFILFTMGIAKAAA